MTDIYKIQVILDAPEDVFRVIEIDGGNTLLDLHAYIKESFSLDGDEMASFYLSNDDWFQGSEIPMESMDESQEETMQNLTIAETLKEAGAKMIYVYDFMSLWTFYVEVLSFENKDKEEYPRVVLAYGDRPKEAPENESMAFDFDLDFDEEDEESDDMGLNGFEDYSDDYNW